jgi:hypothetical protein
LNCSVVVGVFFGAAALVVVGFFLLLGVEFLLCFLGAGGAFGGVVGFAGLRLLPQIAISVFLGQKELHILHHRRRMLQLLNKRPISKTILMLRLIHTNQKRHNILRNYRLHQKAHQQLLKITLLNKTRIPLRLEPLTVVLHWDEAEESDLGDLFTGDHVEFLFLFVDGELLEFYLEVALQKCVHCISLNTHRRVVNTTMT